MIYSFFFSFLFFFSVIKYVLPIRIEIVSTFGTLWCVTQQEDGAEPRHGQDGAVGPRGLQRKEAAARAMRWAAHRNNNKNNRYRFWDSTHLQIERYKGNSPS